MGVPTYGSRKGLEAPSEPHSEVLGTITPDITDPAPIHEQATWTSPSGQTIDLVEEPPPWEVGHATEYTPSDARRFVDVPADWVLRWANPRLIDLNGWEYWKAVSASDSRVTVKVKAMVTVDNLIRRGGQTGDILVWMPRHWVESRRRQFQDATDRLTRSAVDKQQGLKEDFARGKYGQFVKLDTARHPTHTMGEGRTMARD